MKAKIINFRTVLNIEITNIKIKIYILKRKKMITREDKLLSIELSCVNENYFNI